MKHLKFVAFLAYRALVGLFTPLAIYFLIVVVVVAGAVPFLLALALVAWAIFALAEWIAKAYDEFKARSKKEGDS